MLRTCDVEEKQFFVRDHTETLQLTHILHSMLAAYVQYQMFVLNVACPQCPKLRGAIKQNLAGHDRRFQNAPKTLEDSFTFMNKYSPPTNCNIFKIQS